MPIKTTNPYSLKTKSYTNHSKKEVESRILKSVKRSEKYKTTTPTERIAYLKPLKEKLKQNREKYAKLMSQEMGKTYAQALAELDKCGKLCTYYMRHTKQHLADQPIETHMGSAKITYNPLGVVLLIMPWNFPFWQVFRAAIPALMAGNTVLLKHASAVTGCSLALEQLFRVFPPGAFQSLLIKGSQSQPLLADFRIKKVSFTGSTIVGCSIAQNAGASLTPQILELGGNDAYLVLPDADIPHAVKTLMHGRMQNNGQSCIAAKRWLIHHKVYEEFKNQAIKTLQKLKMGDPLDKTTKLGPVVNQDAQKELKLMLKMMQKEGQILHQSDQELPSQGYFIPPTLVEVQGQADIYNNLELFGPIALMYKCSSQKQMIQLANDTEYGLGSGVFSGDIKNAEKIASQLLESGSSFVNSCVTSDPALPFGGIKKSGYGRELSDLGLHSFSNIKTVVTKKQP